MGKLDGLRKVVAQLPVTGANALDIGTGVGVGAWALAEREPATLVSLSIDPQDTVKAKPPAISMFFVELIGTERT
jgi:predicted O-methyltransferase YrrM